MDYLEKRFNFIFPTELNMYYCGQRVHTENHSYGPGIRDHFLLVYIQEGEALLQSKGKIHELRPEHVLFMFPGEKIYYKVKENFKWSILWIGVYGKLVYDFIAPLKITPANPVFPCPSPEKTCKVLEDILVTVDDNSFSGKLQCLSLVYSFFATLAENCKMPIALGHTKSALLPQADANEITYLSNNLLIREAENFIRFHYDSNITVADVAESVNLEMCYFSKLFKRETGMSPKQMIIEYRMNKAIMLLQNTNLTVTEVAGCVGIEDPQYFTRLFKKYTGKSPTALRK